MKIKSLIIVCLAILGLASCSKNGSQTIKLDEFAAVKDNFGESFEGDRLMGTVFSIVPGDYTITWTVKDELPQMTQYKGEMKIKLKLNKKVEIIDEEKAKDSGKFPTFTLVDANGDKNIKNSSEWYIGKDPWGINSNNDLTMEFVEFLRSEPGTVKEITLTSLLVESSSKDYAQQITFITNEAKGLVLNVEDDEFYHRWLKIAE